jgi:hypothetical protein
MDVAPPTDAGSDWAVAFALLPRELAVFSPIPLRSHPFDVQAIDDQAVAWCLEHGLCEPDSRAIRMGCATGIMHGLPFARPHPAAVPRDSVVVGPGAPHGITPLAQR